MALTASWPNPDQTIAAGGIDTAAGNTLSETYYDRVGGMLFYIGGTTGVLTQNGFAIGSSGQQTTTSLTYVDLTDMSVTLTTMGGPLYVFGTVALSVSTASGIRVAASLDGAAEVGEMHNGQGLTNNAFNTTILWRFTSVSAASHTVKLRWKTEVAGTASALVNLRQLLVFESRH